MHAILVGGVYMDAAVKQRFGFGLLGVEEPVCMYRRGVHVTERVDCLFKEWGEADASACDVGK